MNCVSENSLRAYQDGELSAVERVEIRAHLDTCAPCSNRLREITATSERVTGKWLLWAPHRRKQGLMCMPRSLASRRDRTSE